MTSEYDSEMGARARAGGTGILDEILAGVVVVLSVASLAIVAAPQLELLVVSRDLDMVINSVATVAAGAIAALAWIRFKEGGQPIMLFQAAAFTVLAASNAVFMAIELLGYSVQFGSSPLAPTQTPMYAWWIVRLTAGILLVAGGLIALRDRPAPRRPVLVIAIPCLVAFALIALAWRFSDSLPEMASPMSIAVLVTDPNAPHLISVTLLGMLAQLAVGVTYLWGAALFRRLQLRGGPISFAYLTIGLAIAAFSQIHFVAIPGAYGSLVTAGDILRLAFYVVILLGVDADARAGLHELRLANHDLERLRRIEVANAAAEERSRLAREFHDGLAQTLWFAKLKAGRLTSVDGLPDEAREVAGEIGGAMETALAETRQALLALRASAEGGSLPEVLGRYVDDFGERFGLRSEFTFERDLPRLPVRSQAEVMRIVQEALNNVRKHADATLVRVHAERVDGHLVLTVRDNGQGFDPAAPRIGGYGLQGMTERADMIGAHVQVTSAPRDGTTVSVEVPLEREPDAAREPGAVRKPDSGPARKAAREA
jgi:signal transduction histidine kinase